MNDPLRSRRHHRHVERFRPVVTRMFESLSTDWSEWDVEYFMALMWGESQGDPRAHNTKVYADPMLQASGLMQHLPKYFPGRVQAAVKKLRAAGVEEPWMTHPELLEPLPSFDADGRIRKQGIFKPAANIATGVWLYTEKGVAPWSAAHRFPPDQHHPNTRFLPADRGYADVEHLNLRR